MHFSAPMETVAKAPLGRHSMRRRIGDHVQWEQRSISRNLARMVSAGGHDRVHDA